ncbi:MAG: O-antigen ligase family protein, partial [Cyanobacteriota bacterium]
MSIASRSRISAVFAGLTALGYAFFTLLPNSHGLMAAWPFVLVWQLTLGAGFLWGLSQLYLRRRGEGFGQPWDYLTLAGLILVLLSALGAQFRPQALIQSWAVVALVAVLYGLRGWLNPPSPDPLLTPHRRRWLLRGQGALNIGFIVLGLALWVKRIYLPEQALLAAFRAVGVEQSFDFNAIQLRNPYPLGHANYVAGYLLLALPVLLILFLQERGWGRWLWLTGVGAGLADLFLTSSRGGFFALGVLLLLALIGAARWGSLTRRQLWGLMGGALGLGGVLIISNNRLRQTLASLLQGGASSELSFRSITNAVGWGMGRAHWLTGAGLGSVPLLYQKYRPGWAGQEGEWLYEVLSTPMQIFGELGAGGLIFLFSIVLSSVYARWRGGQKSQCREGERR